jgi:hypothetical protein
MAVVSKALIDLLRANLEKVPVPSGYDAFRAKLSDIKPVRKPLAVNESPENTRTIRSPDPE